VEEPFWEEALDLSSDRILNECISDAMCRVLVD
jgi:hypothetical protein